MPNVTRRAFLRWSAGAMVGGSILAACTPNVASPPGSNPSTAVPASGGGKANVLMWPHFGGPTLELFRQFVAEFEKTRPDIEIQIAPVGVSENISKMLQAVAAGAPPDIYHAAGFVQPELVRDKVIVPLDQYVKRPPDLYKAFEEVIVFEGATYGIPLNGGLGAMTYNVPLMQSSGLDPDKLPQSWEELADAAVKMTKASDNLWGIELPNSPNWDTVQALYGFMRSNNADILSPDRTQVTFNSEEAREAVEFYASFTQRLKASPTKQSTAVQTWNDYQTGKLGIINLYPVWLALIRKYPFTSASAPMPKRKGQGTHFAGNYFTISEKSKVKEQAAAFIEWWIKPENNARWTSQSGGLPISQAVTDSPTYQKYLAEEPLARAYIDSIPFAKPFPPVAGITGIIQALAEATESVIFGRADAKTALDAAAKRAEGELRK